MNHAEAGKPTREETKANLIFKRVFRNCLQVVGTDIGYGPCRGFAFF